MSDARTAAVDAEDYKVLASIRAELRIFARFTEANTTSVGLTPQQHQVLLALRASERMEMSVGELAGTMLLEPHSISGMIDRLVKLGLAERVRSEIDRRRVNVRLTDQAMALLASLAQAHKAELRRIRPLLIKLLSELS